MMLNSKMFSKGDLVEPRFILEGPRTAGGLSRDNRQITFQGIVITKPYKMDENSEFFVDLLVHGKILERCFVDDYVESDKISSSTGEST